MFLETICIKNGIPQNIEMHCLRMRETARYFGFSSPPMPVLRNLLPARLAQGRIRCRIVYDRIIHEVSFERYSPKRVRSLKILEAGEIDYRFKYADRSIFDQLQSARTTCDDVLLVNKGCVTDTCYANVVLRNETGLFTPKTCLLNGTKRQRLIRDRVIQETRITIDDLHDYQEVLLINAMLDLDDGITIATHSIMA